MAVSAPPKKKTTQAAVPMVKTDDKKIDEIINRGSSTIGKEQPQQEQDAIKNFNVKLLESQLRSIDELRAKRPRKPTSPKLGISSHDWIVEAIEEKIKRERKLHNIV